MSQLFEYAVIHTPKAKKDRDGNSVAKKSTLIVDVTRTLAGSQEEVSILAARQIPEEYVGILEEVEIVVRPF